MSRPKFSIPGGLILASASPRRRELLAQLGAEFEVAASTVPEPWRKPVGLRPDDWAAALAYFKARAVAAAHPGRWVLGADTMVIVDDEILNKPVDAEDARRMLRRQMGRPSRVVTGIALVQADPADPLGRPRHRRMGCVETKVWMRDDPAAMEAYIASGDWAGKAGAYGIQDVGDVLIERIEGSFSNVVGLPTERVAEWLAEISAEM
jgi:septum formation protein